MAKEGTATMTPDEIHALTNEQLDKALAEAMGWGLWDALPGVAMWADGTDRTRYLERDWHPSTDLAASAELLRMLLGMGCDVEMYLTAPGKIAVEIQQWRHPLPPSCSAIIENDNDPITAMLRAIAEAALAMLRKD